MAPEPAKGIERTAERDRHLFEKVSVPIKFDFISKMGYYYTGMNSKHVFVGQTRIATKVVYADGSFIQTAEKERQFYYHSDHLGSAQLITDYQGEEYERLEYTPYGELWIEKASAASALDVPYRFTGKERDKESGLYYYGARYLDPKDSRWLSTDPAMGEYIPSPGQEVGNLPGMGGVFNVINLHVYHYAGNNPVKYVDPDGREVDDNAIANAEAQLQANMTPQLLKDLINTKNLAGIIVKNRSALDKDTKRFVAQLGWTNKERTERLEALLNNVQVYSGVDADLADNIVSGLSGGNQNFRDGLSVGNNIYMRDAIGTADKNVADLLGHEAIHSIQAAAVGRNTFINYSANIPYTEANKFELAAYKFGGGIDRKTFPSLKGYNQVLKNSGNWW